MAQQLTVDSAYPLPQAAPPSRRARMIDIALHVAAGVTGVSLYFALMRVF